jgi:cardiolipin synthase
VGSNPAGPTGDDRGARNARAPGEGGPGSTPKGRAVADLRVDRIATVPNLLSAARIALIPVFVLLILHHGTETAGLLLLGFVLATDWVDGYIARRSNQVSNLGKILDPVADRLAIAAGLIAVVVAGLFPLWASLLILIRDAVVLAAGVLVAARWRVRIDVRWIGKVATFALMCAVPGISLSRLDFGLANLVGALGWIAFWIGIVLYYAAVVLYAFDTRRAVALAVRGGSVRGDGPAERAGGAPVP